MRLFIAIDLPEDLKQALGRLRVDIHGAHWVPVEQIHLTLAFLGEVEESVVECLAEPLMRIQVAGFKLNFSGFGCFPSRHRPRVLWIGVEPRACLHDLAAKVREAVLACGIPQEDRPFSPHITLARLKFPDNRESDAFLNQPQTPNLGPFVVKEFTLFQSRLMPQGAVHLPVKSFPLAPAGVLA